MFSLKNTLISQDKFTQLLTQLGLLISKSSDFVIDSRKVKSDSIFCAYPGTQVDGRKFIPQAVAAGAKAILFEDGYSENIAINNYAVKNLMQYVGLFAAASKSYPSTQLHCVAVTGTNGKTSISHWLNQAFSYIGQKTAIIGTTGCGVYPNVTDYASTTPDPITLQVLIDDFASEKVQLLAMEVSSHALDQGRVNGMNFKTAIFTNLTQDHLDYHHNMENYYQAKAQLFYWHGLENAIINIDDVYGNRLYSELCNDNVNSKVITYGINNGTLQASNIQLDLSGMAFDLKYREQVQHINVPIIGKFNIHNLLAVFATLLCNGIDFNFIPEIAQNLKPVIGRMDAKIVTDKPLVVVDYSHTPDSLQKALETLQQIPHRKLICVFGCGGNRDKTKRPIMGNIAAKLADLTIVTSDNPRFEDPQAILAEISAGISSQYKFEVIEDRLKAIESAVNLATAQDIVLIAGKGHEDYQEINGVKHHFSDLELRDYFLTGK